MKRAVFSAALCLALAFASVSAPRPQAQSVAEGQPAERTMKHPAGTLAPTPVDPARPWGWAVRASLEHPDQKLYNVAKQKLLDGKQVFSHTIRKFDVNAYCQQAPHYDFTWFEMQHSTMSWADIEKMLAACPRAGAAPMIRMPDALEANVQKATDIGALGIIIPTVDDSAEARDAARYSRYPPVARRSTGGGLATELWTPLVPPGSSYHKSINDNMLVVVMIETVEGVNNALEIASQPGVDVVIQGNNDLEQFSGFAATDDRYQDLLTRIRNATYRAGKFWGNANYAYYKGNRLSPDSRFHQGGPAQDGWVAAARGTTDSRSQ
jgi:2-keto-3-deoxy-L-rhamnonate aldolase RhmA